MQKNGRKIEVAEETVTEIQESPPSKKSVKKEIIAWVQSIVIAVVLALVIQNFVFTGVRVDGQSMEPTLRHNDRLIVWRLGYQPQKGDIVVFEPSAEYDENDYWIKRVIATEGQHVEIDYATASIYVDGEKLYEPYLGGPMTEKGNKHITEIDVPEDCVFVLGDNRNISIDSRVIGAVSVDSLVGKAVLRFWPFTGVETY